jgi:hypothetical protein
MDDFFILGVTYKGKQISYHIPIELWSKHQVYMFADVLENAPEWHGHTSDDVLKMKRLMEFR